MATKRKAKKPTKKQKAKKGEIPDYLPGIGKLTKEQKMLR